MPPLIRDESITPRRREYRRLHTPLHRCCFFAAVTFDLSRHADRCHALPGAFDAATLRATPRQPLPPQHCYAGFASLRHTAIARDAPYYQGREFLYILFARLRQFLP